MNSREETRPIELVSRGNGLRLKETLCTISMEQN